METQNTFTAVKVTSMNGHGERMHEFNSRREAQEFFMRLCDEKNYPYESDSIEAGGIGYDYRIEIEGN